MWHVDISISNIMVNSTNGNGEFRKRANFNQRFLQNEGEKERLVRKSIVHTFFTHKEGIPIYIVDDDRITYSGVGWLVIWEGERPKMLRHFEKVSNNIQLRYKTPKWPDVFH